MNYDEDSELKIDLFKWKGERRIDIEIQYGGYTLIELTVKTMSEADKFIKKLRKITVNKHKVEEDGSFPE